MQAAVPLSGDKSMTSTRSTLGRKVFPPADRLRAQSQRKLADTVSTKDGARPEKGMIPVVGTTVARSCGFVRTGDI
jgi:hypothetical protein